MVTHTLTGAKRHRVYTRMFRSPLLVLEVEVHVSGYQPDAHGGGLQLDHKIWRTATLEDISIVNPAQNIKEPQ